MTPPREPWQQRQLATAEHYAAYAATMREAWRQHELLRAAAAPLVLRFRCKGVPGEPRAQAPTDDPLHIPNFLRRGDAALP